MNTIVIVGGPTASGKTGYALRLAEKLNGEIINADSVQVYRHLNIGSAKGNVKFIRNETILGNEYPIVHLDNSKIDAHLFDIVDPDYSFNVSEYKKLAGKVITDILGRKKTPIIVGGTGLYIDSIIKNYNFDSILPDLNLREELNKLELGELQRRIIKINNDFFESLNNSEQNNPRRLIRIIEKLCADSFTNINSLDHNIEFNYAIKFYYPIFDREELMKKIDLRVVEMFNSGFVEEVQKMMDMGYSIKDKSLNSTGYKQILEMLNGTKICTVDECLKLVQIAHRQYAKRQITWFEGTGRGYKLIKTDFTGFL